MLKAERSKYFYDFSRCLTSTGSIGKSNLTIISWLQNDFGNIDQIFRALLTQTIRSERFTSLSQELYHVNFQTNANNFKSHGNKCAVDISHS